MVNVTLVFIFVHDNKDHMLQSGVIVGGHVLLSGTRPSFVGR